jgi:hypothetical protein
MQLWKLFVCHLRAAGTVATKRESADTTQRAVLAAITCKGTTSRCIVTGSVFGIRYAMAHGPRRKGYTPHVHLRTRGSGARVEECTHLQHA